MATVSYTEQKTSTDVPENVTENVTENRETMILNLIAENTNISTTQLAEKISVTRMTIHRDLEKLKSKGLIERIGPDKGGYWKIISPTP